MDSTGSDETLKDSDFLYRWGAVWGAMILEVIVLEAKWEDYWMSSYREPGLGHIRHLRNHIRSRRPQNHSILNVLNLNKHSLILGSLSHTRRIHR